MSLCFCIQKQTAKPSKNISQMPIPQPLTANPWNQGSSKV
jgi:hypothetical protein